MVDMQGVERLVDDYVTCWDQQREIVSKSGTSVFEDNDCGCEHLQIFRSGYSLDSFRHKELCRLAALLTRQARVQINRDQKMFWSWCTMVCQLFQQRIPAFTGDWFASFCGLSNLLLAKCPVIFRAQASADVNAHLYNVGTLKHSVSGPLACALLEGILRRKNNAYVDLDGTVTTRFTIVKPSGGTQPYKPGTRLNVISHSLLCFQQRTVTARGRRCPELEILMGGIKTIFPSATNVYAEIDNWRNALVHGAEFWINRTPILMNLICLLVIDEIWPAAYTRRLPELRQHAQWVGSKRMRSCWDLYPPDLD